jgi:AraC-like DNA-binding protein
MTITLSQQAYWDLFSDVEAMSETTSDAFDVTRKYPSRLGHGFWRDVDLREGLYLTIADYTLHEDVISEAPDREHPLEYVFYSCHSFINSSTNGDRVFRAGQYNFCGSGTAPKEINHSFARTRYSSVSVHIEPELFSHFLGNSAEHLSPELNHLIRQPTQEYYLRSGMTTVSMQMVLQQLLNCPYQGVTKRLYLECKVWELLTLLIEQEAEVRSSKPLVSPSLKPEDVDRIHYAREILLSQLDNPPSLIDLARQVGLNDCTFKRGFRQVFGMPAFCYLHHYRLEKARQMLESGKANIADVAQSVGFASRSYFAAAFRKKFGINPSVYLNQRKNSA